MFISLREWYNMQERIGLYSCTCSMYTILGADANQQEIE
jgi:hypothetical protein